MSGTRTNPDHSRPCNSTLALCFPYLSLLSVFILSCNITHSQVIENHFSYKQKVKLIYILFTRPGPDQLLRHTAARILLLLLEPLDFLFDLLRVNLRPTVL